MYTSVFIKKIPVLAGVFFLSWTGLYAVAPLASVPQAVIDFEADVDSWWMAHPFNAQSARYNPEVASPHHTVRLNPGDSIELAIAGLPASGGTLLLEQGVYSGDFSLIGLSNVHIIAPESAQINVPPGNPITLAASEKSANYHTFNYGVKHRDPDCLDDWFNRSRNLLFRNLIFDGGGRATTLVNIKTSDGVLFEGCTFRNARNPGTGHGGLVVGHAGADSIWFRKCHFAGSQQWAVYLDGGYGCGIIDSVIEDNFLGGILFLCNEDFTMDLDRNGSFEKSERRNMQYSVVVGTQFNGTFRSVVSATGNDLLIQENTLNGSAGTFAFFNPKTSLINQELKHFCYDLYVQKNHVEGKVIVFAWFHHQLDAVTPGWSNKSHIGRYIVRRNRVSSSLKEAIRHTGVIDGPNKVYGNRWKINEASIDSVER